MSKYEIENVKLTAPKFDRKNLEYAMAYRYACKKFDSTKKISDDDWQGILTAARLSPTSLGFEAYQLLKRGSRPSLKTCLAVAKHILTESLLL